MFAIIIKLKTIKRVVWHYLTTPSDSLQYSMTKQTGNIINCTINKDIEIRQIPKCKAINNWTLIWT